MIDKFEEIKSDSKKAIENRKILRILLSMISLVVVGLGVMAILNEHYYGISTRYGYKEVNVDGIQAIRIGVTLILLGLIPMGVWWKTARQVMVWSIGCVMAFGVALGYTLMRNNT